MPYNSIVSHAAYLFPMAFSWHLFAQPHKYAIVCPIFPRRQSKEINKISPKNLARQLHPQSFRKGRSNMEAIISCKAQSNSCHKTLIVLCSAYKSIGTFP